MTAAADGAELEPVSGSCCAEDRSGSLPDPGPFARVLRQCQARGNAPRPPVEVQLSEAARRRLREEDGDEAETRDEPAHNTIGVASGREPN